VISVIARDVKQGLRALDQKQIQEATCGYSFKWMPHIGDGYDIK
jgi:hypothetical protein